MYLNHFLIPGCTNCQQLKGNQDDPCKVKSRIVGDETYCDRYWECVNGQPELYDCPNGLVYAGKNRGVTEGCDYPWRSNYCDNKQQASKLFSSNQSKTCIKHHMFQTHQSERNTAAGFMAFSGTKLPAPGTGPAGTVPPQNSFVSADYFITNARIPVIGLKMLTGAKNTVRCDLFTYFLTYVCVFSVMQRRRQWKRAFRKILQQVLAMSRGLPSFTEVSSYVGLRPQITEMRCAPH